MPPAVPRWRVDCEHPARVWPVLVHCGQQSLISRLVLTPEAAEAPPPRAAIAVAVQLGALVPEPWPLAFADHSAQGALAIERPLNPPLTIDPHALARAEAERSLLEVLVDRTPHASFPLETMPATAIPLDLDDMSSLAALVFPDDPAVVELVRSARAAAGVEAARRGFPAKSARETAALLYRQLQQRCESGSLAYAWEQAPANHEMQNIRPPRRILSEGQGTCIDLALLLASMLEHTRRLPVIVGLSTGRGRHVLAGVRRRDQDVDLPFRHGLSEVLESAAANRTFLLDPDGLSRGLDAAAADALARERLQSAKSAFVVDVQAARELGIWPLPIGELAPPPRFIDAPLRPRRSALTPGISEALHEDVALGRCVVITGGRLDPALARDLARLPFQTVASIAPDPALERALSAAQPPYRTIIPAHDETCSGPAGRALYLLGGSALSGEASIDARRRIRAVRMLPGLTGVLSWSILLLGCELSDYHFQELFHELTLGQTDLSDRIYACGCTGVEHAFWAERRPRVLELSPAELLRALPRTPAGPQARPAVKQAAGGKAAQPYRYLDYFEPEHADLFFGRDDDAGAVSLAIRAARGRMTILFGRSGVGKTSLVKALLIPRLAEDPRLMVHYVRTGGDPERSIALALALGASSENLTLQEALRELSSRFPGREQLVFVDQFEEAFFHSSAAVLDDFFLRLASCTADQDLSARFVFIIREDFLAKLAHHARSVRDATASVCSLKELSREAAEQAIVEPAKRAGLTVEPAFVEALLDDLSPDTVLPAHLQIVCHRMYLESGAAKALTLELYDQRLGRTRRILERYLEDAMALLPADEEPDARAVLRGLITSRQTKDLVSIEQLAARTGFGGVRLERVIRRLVHAHRLVREVPGEPVRYELSHDTLAAAVVGWIDTVERRTREVQEMLDQELSTLRRFPDSHITEAKLRLFDEHAAALELAPAGLVSIVREYARHGPVPPIWLERFEEAGPEAAALIFDPSTLRDEAALHAALLRDHEPLLEHTPLFDFPEELRGAMLALAAHPERWSTPQLAGRIAALACRDRSASAPFALLAERSRAAVVREQLLACLRQGAATKSGGRLLSRLLGLALKTETRSMAVSILVLDEIRNALVTGHRLDEAREVLHEALRSASLYVALEAANILLSALGEGEREVLAALRERASAEDLHRAIVWSRGMEYAIARPLLLRLLDLLPPVHIHDLTAAAIREWARSLSRARGELQAAIRYAFNDESEKLPALLLEDLPPIDQTSLESMTPVWGERRGLLAILSALRVSVSENLAFLAAHLAHRFIAEQLEDPLLLLLEQLEARAAGNPHRLALVVWLNADPELENVRRFALKAWRAGYLDTATLYERFRSAALTAEAAKLLQQAGSFPFPIDLAKRVGPLRTPYAIDLARLDSSLRAPLALVFASPPVDASALAEHFESASGPPFLRKIGLSIARKPELLYPASDPVIRDLRALFQTKDVGKALSLARRLLDAEPEAGAELVELIDAALLDPAIAWQRLIFDVAASQLESSVTSFGSLLREMKPVEFPERVARPLAALFVDPSSGASAYADLALKDTSDRTADALLSAIQSAGRARSIVELWSTRSPERAASAIAARLHASRDASGVILDFASRFLQARPRHSASPATREPILSALETHLHGPHAAAAAQILIRESDVENLSKIAPLLLERKLLDSAADAAARLIEEDRADGVQITRSVLEAQAQAPALFRRARDILRGALGERTRAEILKLVLEPSRVMAAAAPAALARFGRAWLDEQTEASHAAGSRGPEFIIFFDVIRLLVERDIGSLEKTAQRILAAKNMEAALLASSALIALDGAAGVAVAREILERPYSPATANLTRSMLCAAEGPTVRAAILRLLESESRAVRETAAAAIASFDAEWLRAHADLVARRATAMPAAEGAPLLRLLEEK